MLISPAYSIFTRFDISRGDHFWLSLSFTLTAKSSFFDSSLFPFRRDTALSSARLLAENVR
jgi:hypothetical protein